MTSPQEPHRPGPPPGYYRAVDGKDYPVPPGYVIGADGNFHPAPPPAQFTGQTMRTSSWAWNAASVLTIAGAGTTFIAAFLPWATIGALSIAGTEGDGVLTLMLSIAAGAFTIFGILRAKTALLVCGLISAALITLISGYDITNVNSVASGPFGLEPDVGGGLYLTLAGGIAGMLGAALALKDAR